VSGLRFRIEWGELSAVEARADELAPHAHVLAAAYNDPKNASLLGHTAEIDEAEVVEHYADMLAEGARPFLLFIGDDLAGDGDLRNLHDGAAEFAFLIAAPAAQGKGLGTRFAVMIHAFGFRILELARIYASIVPANVASRRVFDKLGYTIDDSPTAREFADEVGDVVMSIDRETFERVHAASLAAIRIAEVG
jgi:RimJ/RimL family protein N-acetyltransferase